MMDIKVAVCQFDIIWEDTRANLQYLTDCLMELEEDTDVLVLPEMFHCGFSMSPEQVAQIDGGKVLEWMQQMAGLYDIAVIGSVVVKTGDDFVNRLYVVQKEVVEYYDKRHLFTMGQEHLHYKKGERRLLVEIKGWRFCPLICYDLRFPVWSRNRDNEYDVLIYVANWPASRREVWNILLKARAIENQSYVIGVNRIGKDASLNYAGDSQVLDAKGQLVSSCQSDSGVFYVNLSKTELNEFRTKFPVWNDGDDFELLV